MFDKLRRVKENGYRPDIILDIGAHHGNWTRSMLSLYDDSEYYLFEAIEYDELKCLSVLPNIKQYNVLLNDTAKEVDWYEMKNTGDSMFREKTHHFENCMISKRNSIDLDSFIRQESIVQDRTKRVFIKIDCQGAEIPILKGASEIIKQTDFILLELPLFGQYNEGVPTFLEHIQYMESIGFVPYDIIDNHYINGFNMQIDMLFINKEHAFYKAVNSYLDKTVYE